MNEDAYRKREAELYDQIYDLRFDLAGVRVELEQQAVLNGKGAERELALRAKVEMLERGNAALRAAQDQLVMTATMAKAYLEQHRYGHGIEDPLWHLAKKALAAVSKKEQP